MALHWAILPLLNRSPFHGRKKPVMRDGSFKTCLLFDLDGTLLDSIGIYYDIVDIVFERLKLPPIPRERFVEAAKDGDFEWDYV